MKFLELGKKLCFDYVYGVLHPGGNQESKTF